MRKKITKSRRRNPGGLEPRNVYAADEILFGLEQLIDRLVSVSIQKLNYVLTFKGTLKILREQPGWFVVVASMRNAGGYITFNGEKVFMIDFKTLELPIIVLEKDRGFRW